MKKLLVLLLLLAVPANATMLLEFDQEGEIGGTIIYDGEGGAMAGTDIVFTEVTGINTPSNDGVQLDFDSALLSFTTGLNLTEGIITTFAGGGSWSMEVDIPVQGAFTTAYTGNLFTGTINSATVVDGSFILQMVMSGTDTKDEVLRDFYGLPDYPFVFGFTAQSLDFTKLANGGFTMREVQNADIIQSSVIPEPSSIMLLGIGLLGAAYVYRRS